VQQWLMLDGAIAGWTGYEAAVAAQPAERICCAGSRRTAR
jgi:hypothetical protein